MAAAMPCTARRAVSSGPTYVVRGQPRGQPSDRRPRLEDDAPRYVIEALSKVGRPLDIDDLASHYEPPKPNDLADYRHDLRDGSRQGTNDEAKYYLIEEAIEEINQSQPGLRRRDRSREDRPTRTKTRTTMRFIDEVLVQDDKHRWRLADGVDVDKLVWRNGEPLVRKSPLPDLFGPGTGLWVNNSRSIDPSEHKDLRQSMQALGWLKHLPAIGCKRTEVIIVGHRRKAVAEALGIEPVIEWVDFGEGPAAEAAKAALAIASNRGGKPLSPADRTKIAADLYGDGNTKFTMQEIGKLLNVSAKTISYDLRGFTKVKPPKSRGGRPRNKPTPEPQPEPQPEPEPEPETPAPEPETTKLTVAPKPEPEPITTTAVTVSPDRAVFSGHTTPQPESALLDPEVVVVDADIMDLIADVGDSLTRLKAHIEALNEFDGARAFDDHLDRVAALARLGQETLQVLTHAKSRYRLR